MGEFASKGVAGAGLGTGIAGLALGVLNSGAGLMGGLGRNTGWGNGNWSACGNWGGNPWGWNGQGAAFDMSVSEALAERDARIAQLEAEKYADSVGLGIYKYFDGELKEIRQELCDQKVFNATATGGLGALGTQLAALQGVVNGITRTAVPASAVCDFNSSGCPVQAQ